MRRFLFLLFFLAAALAEAKAPELSAKDVKHKIQEILRAHAAYKRLTPELIERSLVNFLEEIDPGKTYLLRGEAALWDKPSEGLLSQILDEVSRGDFRAFYEMHTLLGDAIRRRNEMEGAASAEPLPSGVTSSEFKNVSFANSQEELLDRLRRTRAFQIEAAAKFTDENRDMFLQRLHKKRLSRETELWSDSRDERMKIAHALFLKALASSLDAHTNYFTPSEASQFMIQVQQRLFGIGAQLRDDLNGFTIVRIIENSPASHSKLKLHDRIIAVNGEPIIGYDITDAVDLIRGEEGTPVLLTVVREGGEKLEYELIRKEVVLEESRMESRIEPFGYGAIGCLKLHSFYQDGRFSSAADLRKAIEAMNKEHSLQGILLDLRNNAGGLLPQAVAVSGLFTRKGIIASIKDNSGKVQHLRECEGNPAWEGPLVILVNRASASAAEIVAQALQDYGRAIVVGDEHTFGKGTFQTFTLDPTGNPRLNPQGEYKVTRGRYYTVSGKSPQLIGVLADIAVPGPLSSLDLGEEFSKFPLANDQIPPHFDDDLSDLSPLHRLQLGPMYRYHLQERLSVYTPFLEILRKNSDRRIKANKLYAAFLEKLQKKDCDADTLERMEQGDLQGAEAMNILKDLIYFTKIGLSDQDRGEFSEAAS